MGLFAGAATADGAIAIAGEVDITRPAFHMGGYADCGTLVHAASFCCIDATGIERMHERTKTRGKSG